MRFSSSGDENQTVVIGISDGFGDLRLSEVVIEKDLLVRRKRAAHGRVGDDDRGLVLVHKDSKVVPGTTLVICLQRDSAPNAAFDAEIVDIGVGAPQMRIDSLKAQNPDRGRAGA